MKLIFLEVMNTNIQLLFMFQVKELLLVLLIASSEITKMHQKEQYFTYHRVH